MITRIPTLPIACPACHKKTHVRLADLEAGKPHTCRHCGKVVKPNAEFTRALQRR